jgi:2-polyprenyl-6-methoxyphenol hydroxylase-like FAD-dependent oxidoreductase
MKIGIIGCGVAGMASAILLSRAGHDVTVLERFAQPRPLGAGLLLQPTGLAVLDRLGLGAAARAAGAPIAGIRGLTVGGRKVLDLSYGDLAPSGTGPGCAGLGIHRAVLFDLLFQALSASAAQLVCGAEIVDLVSGEDRVAARDSAGNLHGPFEALLVCDGAHSRLRQHHGALRAAPLYPWACVWATLPDPERRFAGWLHQRFRSTTTMIGILPIGRDPTRRDAGSAVTLFWSLPRAQLETWPQHGFAAWRDEVATLWPQLAPLLAGLKATQDFSHATYRDVGLRRWRQGRVLFLGDCCHGTSPQLGQGANLALLDAWVLGREIAKGGDVVAALDRVGASRRGQVDFYRQASRWLTPFYQSRCRPLGWLRDLGFGLACRWRPTRHLMLTTLAGLRCGWWRSQRLDGRAGFELERL